MLLWANGGVQDDPKSVFDGTIGSLIKIYETHKRSPFKTLRYKTHLSYASSLRALAAAVGEESVTNLTFEDLLDWQDQFALDANAVRKGRAAGLMGHLKRVIRFGALVLPRAAGCHDVCDMIAKMRGMFGGGSGKRIEYITADQCIAFRAQANRRGRHSMALVQAIAFECGVRPKDVYGEWIPVSWPGTSDIIRGGYKWLMGARWEEIDADLVWRHRLSKSVRGKDAVARPEGKVEEFDLSSYPMVMAELPSLRGSGPLIVNEQTGYPWNEKQFQKVWRDIARQVAIPDNVQNRDSRAGAATEAELAGANPKTVQRMLGHSRIATTERYIRGGRETRNAIAQLRNSRRTTTANDP